ncbi:hypothetical protein HFN80_05645 [Rhizobium laguerreae]|uniref:hypothetical protein n=1 Tax=Rhizobium TaxID=379 RepID=UPI000A9654A8|nr:MULTISPECIES: hypothetical protein [Rhizobium]MBY3463497.1 hypothetical protein [Rhizobium laguerreae]
MIDAAASSVLTMSSRASNTTMALRQTGGPQDGGYILGEEKVKAGGMDEAIKTYS